MPVSTCKRILAPSLRILAMFLLHIIGEVMLPLLVNLLSNDVYNVLQSCLSLRMRFVSVTMLIILFIVPPVTIKEKGLLLPLFVLFKDKRLLLPLFKVFKSRSDPLIEPLIEQCTHAEFTRPDDPLRNDPDVLGVRNMLHSCRDEMLHHSHVQIAQRVHTKEQVPDVEAALQSDYTTYRSRVLHRRVEIGPQTGDLDLDNLSLQIAKAMRRARQIDENCTLQFGCFALLKYKDGELKWWRLQEHWTPIIDEISCPPLDILDFFTGHKSQWNVRGSNLEHTMLEASTANEKEEITILSRFKMDSGEDVLLCAEPGLIWRSALLFWKGVYICALNSIIDREEGLDFDLQSESKNVTKVYWTSVVEGLRPSPRTLMFIIAKLLLLGIFFSMGYISQGMIVFLILSYWWLAAEPGPPIGGLERIPTVGEDLTNNHSATSVPSIDHLLEDISNNPSPAISTPIMPSQEEGNDRVSAPKIPLFEDLSIGIDKTFPSPQEDALMKMDANISEKEEEVTTALADTDDNFSVTVESPPAMVEYESNGKREIVGQPGDDVPGSSRTTPPESYRKTSCPESPLLDEETMNIEEKEEGGLERIPTLGEDSPNNHSPTSSPSIDHLLEDISNNPSPAISTPVMPSQEAYQASDVFHTTLKEAEVVLKKFDVSLQMEANRSSKSSEAALNHARALLSKGMIKLEEEFKSLLSHHSKVIDPAMNGAGSPGAVDGKVGTSPHSPHSPGGDLNKPVQLPQLIPPRIIPQLQEMAKRMVGAGHHQQCLKVYRDVRSATLEQSLKKLGVEKLSKEDIQKMQIEALEGKINNWIQYMQAAVKLLFAGERKLCDQIFYHLDPLRERAFAEVTESSTTMLISFGDAIARSKKSPEKLFVLLDMYETMRDLLPEIEVIFSGEYAAGACEAARNLLKKLALTASETFGDFEDAVEKDATKAAVLDGTVHPLTSYVINYVKFLLDYQSTLKQLFGEPDIEDKSDSKLANSVKRILQVLQSNLDGKSKLYKDPALTQLFLMNNGHYIVKSVRKSEAKDMLGEDWVQRQRRIVQQRASLYQRAAWAKALSYLGGSGLSQSQGGSGGLSTKGDASGTGISRAALKERFKNFNAVFEDLHLRQSQWTIPDLQLRESVRLAIEEVLLPAYRSFLKRYGHLLQNGKNPQKYIKYTPEDLSRLLGEFFEGKTRADQRRS